MRLGTKILLLMLLITLGTSALLAFIVRMNVTSYETRRANERISQAIDRYVTQLEDRHRQIQKIVTALLEAPVPRSQLQAADEAGDPTAQEQLKQEVIGRTVQTELESPGGNPAFHVLVNHAGQVVLTVAPNDPALEKSIASADIRWPADPVMDTEGHLTSYYLFTSSGLFLAMGVPLHTQLDEAPSHAYFVGFRVDDRWIRRQLLSERRSLAASDAPVSAWFVVNGAVVAGASSEPSDERIQSFTGKSALRVTGQGVLPASRSLSTYETIEFTNAGEHYLGQSFDIQPGSASSGRLVLASSLDEALLPLRSLQQQILLCTLGACLVAVFACRLIARRIANPIQQLLTGTRQIAAGHFDELVDVRRRDELGLLAKAFNSMSQGLKERDVLRDQRTKSERDLALARKIQLDVLPKSMPPCPGYDLAAYSRPAEQTGGDIYDLVALALDDENGGGNSSLVLLLADAAGHGIGPALSVTQVRAMLRIGVRLRASLASVFSQINRQLCQDLGAERFVTAFLGLLDPDSHTVNYHSAGQGPLLHLRSRDRRLCWLNPSTLPLGIDEDPEDLGVQRIDLEPGDVLVLLTDGFYEFRNAEDELFSKERVAKVVLEHLNESAKSILDVLLTATRSFADGAPQLDDMTALIIKRHSDGHTPDRPGPIAPTSAVTVEVKRNVTSQHERSEAPVQ